MSLGGYFLAILITLGSGIYVGSGLFLIGFVSDRLSLGILPGMMGNIAWNTMNEFILLAIPLFILLGEILMRSGAADRMYKALAVWVDWLPGGLIHANIAACALFAATSGSSVATAATIGTVAQPTLLQLGYEQRMVLGSIAAGGTLGILIPPSITMIVYGALTNTSVGKLFAAGIIPGIILATTMSLIVIVLSLVKGQKVRRAADALPLAQRIYSLRNLLPVLFVFLVIMGSIYGGFATPTEAAGLGVFAALILAGLNRTLSIRVLHEAFLATVKTTSMLLLVIVCAFMLNFQLSVSGVPQEFASWMFGLGLGPYQTIWLLVIFYAILGCFLEALAMMVTTIGIVFPLVTAIGFDGVWLGIFMTIMTELALITPPVGLNLYVVQSIRIKPGNISDIIIGVLPFVVAIFIFLALLIYFPQVALWLPEKIF